MRLLRFALLGLAVSLSADMASATSVTFLTVKCVQSSKDCGTIGSEFSIEVIASGTNKVSFRLDNSQGNLSSSQGSKPLNASQIFFDDNSGILQTLLDVTDGNGVDFAKGGNPSNLKGGSKIGFSADFLASAAKPTKENGVGPGEDVLINFMVFGGHTADDVIAALEAGSLRIGVNAKTAFVTAAGTVPEPGTLLLLGLGGAVAALAARRS